MREHEEPLPRIEDLPLAENGYDPERVEHAFDRFERRLVELESRLGVLDDVRDELRRLRAAAAPGEETMGDGEEWPADALGAPAPDPRWVASVPPPVAHPSPAPRLALEAAFLLAVALLSALAGLGALQIVGLMAVAWALVAANEWVTVERRARRYAAVEPRTVGEDTEEASPWDVPPVEATVIAPPDESESHTIVARLPEPPEPRRPRLPWRRRRDAEPAAPDPWEADSEA